MRDKTDLQRSATSLTRMDLVGLLAATRLTTMSNTTLSNWLAAGCPRNADGSFSLLHVAAWLAEERRKRSLNERKLSASDRERHRVQTARADLLEMQIASRKRELLPKAEVMEQFRAAGGRLRKRLEVIEKRHGRQVGNDIRAIIDEVYRDLGLATRRQKKTKVA